MAHGDPPASDRTAEVAALTAEVTHLRAEVERLRLELRRAQADRHERPPHWG